MTASSSKKQRTPGRKTAVRVDSAAHKGSALDQEWGPARSPRNEGRSVMPFRVDPDMGVKAEPTGTVLIGARRHLGLTIDG
jgi:hypothetical protein